eukprot:jgi/Bigna1/71081/fgenesh1_pg.14_\
MAATRRHHHEDHGASTPLPKIQIPSKVLTGVGIGMIVGTILTTYALFVEEGKKPIFLPTISNTWEAPPGNYISRFFAGYACDMLYMAAIFIYWARVTVLAQSPEPGFIVSEGVLLVISLDCRGGPEIHVFCAVTFFVLFDMFGIITSAQTPHSRGIFARRVDVLLVGISIISKVRFIPGIEKVLDETPLAVFEWSNVGAICGWVVHYVFTFAPSVNLSFVKVVSRSIARYLRSISLGACVMTLLSTLIATAVFGELPSGHLPFISDLWVYVPGDWISRWGTIQGCTCAIVSQIFLYLARTDDGSETGVEEAMSQGSIAMVSRGQDEEDVKELMASRRVEAAVAGATAYEREKYEYPLLILSVVAFLGLSVVGCVDEKANITVHSIAAGVFFGGFDIYMFLRMILNAFPIGYKRQGWVVFVLSVLSKQRFLISREPETLITTNFEVILEWTNTFCIVYFMYLEVFKLPNTTNFYLMVLGHGGSRSSASTDESGGSYARISGY